MHVARTQDPRLDRSSKVSLNTFALDEAQARRKHPLEELDCG